jgi:hypothetical protein
MQSQLRLLSSWFDSMYNESWSSSLIRVILGFCLLCILIFSVPSICVEEYVFIEKQVGIMRG